MALEVLAALTALGLLARKGGGKTEPGPRFPADNTAVVHPPPTAIVTVPPASSSVPATAPATVPASVPAAPPPRPGTGVLPGTPEPGWQPYSPPPSLVVARARQVLSSGQLRVTEADPTGRFRQVRYRRERNPSTGIVSVTAWRPAGAVANA